MKKGKPQTNGKTRKPRLQRGLQVSPADIKVPTSLYAMPEEKAT